MTLPAGTYWIGDLCYVLEADDEWDEVCDLTILEDAPWACSEGEFVMKDGRRFAMYNTKYGDGSYNDQNGFSYSVDSGSIGCILVSDIRGEVSKEGSIVTFDREFSTGSDSGVIRIGNIRIDTDPEEELEYEESEE